MPSVLRRHAHAEPRACHPSARISLGSNHPAHATILTRRLPQAKSGRHTTATLRENHAAEVKLGGGGNWSPASFVFIMYSSASIVFTEEVGHEFQF